MATFYRALLPSGFGVKYREMKTRDMLVMQRAVKAIKGDEISSELHSIAACVVAITRPLPLVFVKALKRGTDGKPVTDASGNPTGEMVDTNTVDIDATLNATKDSDWIPVKFDPTDCGNPGGIYDVFQVPQDFNKVLRLIDDMLGTGVKSRSLLAGEAQLVSDGS